MKIKVVLLFVFFAVSSNADRRIQTNKRTSLSNHDKQRAMEVKLEELTQKVNELTLKLSIQESNMTSQADTIKSCEERLQDLTNVTQDKTDPFPVKSATFIRWGRTACPSNISELVYAGYAGSSWLDHPGAAAEYLCMPSDPQWEPNAGKTAFAFVYGVEYADSMAGTPHTSDNAPCAVCMTTNTSVTLMIPGRTSCYPEWTDMYSGYLAAGHYLRQASTQYACVDTQPEFVMNGSKLEYGQFFEPVSSRCGSLPCPPYEEMKKLSCVVCAK